MCESLLGYNKEYWWRDLFSERSKCDVVKIICVTHLIGGLVRHKYVNCILEDIRHKMMEMHRDMIKFADTWMSDISSMTRLNLEENKEIDRELRVN